MTQEDKELLIKDLCARLPYSGVQIHVSYEDGFEYDKTLTYEDVKNYCIGGGYRGTVDNLVENCY